MTSYIDNLRLLNRKERFYLVGFALDRPDFALGDNFRRILQRELNVTVPPDAFVAMDYHISWLYAAAVMTKDDGTGQPFQVGGGIEKGNQEDIDLVIAFEEGSATQLLIIEAKGVTGWSNSQLRSKVARLKDIFGDEITPTRFPFIIPRFLIVSPRVSTRVDTKDWPVWMKQDGRVQWIRMPTPDDLLKVTRCDKDKRTTRLGGFWKVEPDPLTARVARNRRESDGD
ncbi:MAG: hypothetical protein WEC33_07580 [Dehalococcoidia bacterium]